MAKTYACLDVGERRIGVALADDTVRIAIPYDTFLVDGSEYEQIINLIVREEVSVLVVGYPRNQAGEPTAQTEFVEAFMAGFPKEVDVKIVYQDESLTSVIAEDRLKAQKKPYQKADIDMMAASIILQDYLEEKDGRI